MEVKLNASALSDSNAFYVPVTIISASEIRKDSDITNYDSPLVAKSLLDCGSDHCFIDNSFVNKHELPLYSVGPYRLRYLNGSSSTITQGIQLRIKFPTGEIHLQEFLVTILDSPCDMVLGYNWLHQFNPLIDWTVKSLSFRRTPSLGLSTPVPSMETLNPTIESVSASHSQTIPLLEVPESPIGNLTSSIPSQTPLVSLISAAAYACAIRQKGSIQYTIRTQPSDVHGRSSGVSPIDLEGLPSEYRDYADVFNEQKASFLAPHRGEYDLHIETENNEVPPIGHIYSLSQPELIALREFIDENLKSGFIYPSKSTHGAPILFVKKKDGSLRLCVDYRGLNRLTRKDRYPLPLITDLLDAPAKARVYTKLDLRHAYHLLRIAEGDEPKTAFRTRYGSFEWRVMPFGLTNAPAAFQRFVNSIFADLLDVCVVVYLDDILIYSDSPEEHTKHVQEVLRRLREQGLYCKLSKCEFSITTCEYLGYILSSDGLKMSSEKVQAIQDWPVPRKVKDIQSFLGFCNFYRRFIPSYSNITIPLTRLTRSKVKWNWSEAAQKAFDTLKEAFGKPSILHHWEPNRQITVETDASDYAIASILSITSEDGEIYPVAFRSRSLTPPELNYDVHDKELLAIYDAFKHWRHYLEGSPIPIDVVTDHKNLEYFSTTKVLTRRQVRWSEFLSPFNMVIRFRPGKLGAKPDALTRRWDVYPKEGDNTYAKVNPHNFRPVFTNEQLQSSLRATYLEEPVLRAAVVMDTVTLHSEIREALPTDPETAKGLSAVKNKTSPRWSLDEDGLLKLDNRIYVPRVGGTSDSLRIKVLQNLHDHILAGHFGQNRTLDLVRRTYVWPELRTFVRDWCRSCVHCKRNKKPRHRPYGLLKPLPVPERPWHSISADFITDLPNSNGYNSILVIVDRASKQGIFIPCDKHITSVDVAQLFLVHVFAKHGIPTHVTSDRDKDFVAQFMKSLGELLNIEFHYTSGYHPEADGQTERANQTLEQYIRMYCNYQQDDWDRLLPFAEFAYNNAPNASTGITPFFANKGYHPSVTIHPEKEVASSYAKDFVVNLQELHTFLKEQITEAQAQFKETADRKRAPVPNYNIGDKAFILAKFIKTTRPTPKFSETYLGPFEIIAKPSTHAFTFRLPQHLRSIHPVFHVSQIEPHTPNPFPERSESPPPPIRLEDGDEYELKAILDSKLDRRYRVKLRYYVEWEGYEGTDEQYSWIGADDIGKADELLSEFHKRYPNKPGPNY